MSTKTFIFLDLILILLLGLFFQNYFFQRKSSIVKNQYLVEAEKIYTQCRTSKTGNCYNKELSRTARKNGLKGGEKVLIELQGIDPSALNCHLFAHVMGSAVASTNISQWKKLLKEANPATCGGGFFHGVLEAYIETVPDFKITKEFISDICGLKIKNNRAVSCFHMFGHLAVLEKKGDIEKAFPICEKLFKEAAFECYMGVFMENSFKILLSDHGLAKIPERNHERFVTEKERCFKYRGVQADGCWTNLAEIITEYYNFDTKKTYENCYSAPEKLSREKCYIKAVALMAVSPTYDSKEKLSKLCSVYLKNKSLHKSCSEWVLGGLLFNSPHFSNRAILFCENSPRFYKKGCFAKIGENLKINIPDAAEREKYCESTSREYMEHCVQG